MGLQDYLAKNYLSADTKPSKKRKRKDAAKAEGLTIADDEDNSWAKTARNGDDDDDAPTIAGTTFESGNKPKKSTWVKIGVEAPKDSDQIAADKILVDAQAESNARDLEDDQEPAIVEGDQDGPTMASGAMAGLQTAEQVTAALRRKEKAERKAMKAAGLDPTGVAQQTIYRDASGRMINVKEKKAELAEKAQDAERKKREELESRKGDVQRREKVERRQALEDAKFMTVARHADDEKLNDELRDKERWNDPMAQLLATKKESGSGKGGKSKGSGKSYQGAAEPNRYGIRPGWRWDGVDRSNGFERKWFQARNRANEKKALQYSSLLDE